MLAQFTLLTTIMFVVPVFSDDNLFSFIALGDWGGAALDDQHKKNVYSVAKQLNTTATSVRAKFLINTGDNFYWCGIQNTSDFQIQTDFLEPYDYPSLKLKWYSSLGNHEYGYNVDAQIEYGKINSDWVLPARYYTTRLELAAGIFATLLVLDTSPCLTDYRNSNQKYWDPCSTTYPTCSLTSTNDDFEGECEFHANILSQDCGAQYDWLQATLPTIPSSDWLIVVGHHPIDEVNVLDFTTLLQSRGFSIYLNGHSHALTHYTIDNKGAYVTSGAGALVNTYDQTHPITALKVNGGNIARDPTVSASHSYQTVFNQKVAGFTVHTFSEDFSTLLTEFVTYTGSVIHSFTVNKAGAVIA